MSGSDKHTDKSHPTVEQQADKQVDSAAKTLHEAAYGKGYEHGHGYAASNTLLHNVYKTAEGLHGKDLETYINSVKDEANKDHIWGQLSSAWAGMNGDKISGDKNWTKDGGTLSKDQISSYLNGEKNAGSNSASSQLDQLFGNHVVSSFGDLSKATGKADSKDGNALISQKDLVANMDNLQHSQDLRNDIQGLTAGLKGNDSALRSAFEQIAKNGGANASDFDDLAKKLEADGGFLGGQNATLAGYAKDISGLLNQYKGKSGLLGDTTVSGSNQNAYINENQFVQLAQHVANTDDQVYPGGTDKSKPSSGGHWYEPWTW